MLDNENAKGKSDLVFSRNNESSNENISQLKSIYLIVLYFNLGIKLSINDFNLIKVLGRGAFGKVIYF